MNSPIDVTVRDETPADHPVIAAVQELACRDHPFSQQNEAQIVARLRERGVPTRMALRLDRALPCRVMLLLTVAPAPDFLATSEISLVPKAS